MLCRVSGEPMAKLQLIRAAPNDGLWAALRSSWDRQLKRHKAPVDWAEPYLSHAESIIAEAPPDHRYGIYIACGGSNRSNAGAPYEGFVHINFKLMYSSAAEVRLVWNRIAPKYQFEDLKESVAAIQATFLVGAISLSANNNKKPPVKMFLGNPIDLSFGRSFALFINAMPSNIKAAVRGNWLHISWAKKARR